MSRIIEFDDDFITALTDAIGLIDTLGQLQSMAGGLSMEHRAGHTFETHARLENGLRRIIHNAQKEQRKIRLEPEAIMALGNTLEALGRINNLARDIRRSNRPDSLLDILDELSGGWESERAVLQAARGQEAS